MAHVLGHSFIRSCKPCIGPRKCAECSAIRGCIRDREAEGERFTAAKGRRGGGQSFSIFRRAQSGLVVRSTNIGNGAVYCVGDKEGAREREGARLRNERNVELPFAVA